MFRQKYLDYAEFMQLTQEWSKAHPDLVRLSSLGKTAEGREIPLLTIGRDPGEARPAVWIDGNMHASELCGSSVALAIADDVLTIHRGGTAASLPAHMADAVKDILFYIVPRMSPDGAEAVLKTGRYVRSSPVDGRVHKGHAYWENADIDGDGNMGYMRQQCVAGELVELPGTGGAMVPRMPEDVGPFYKLYPEGRIANFDGRHIPDPHFLSDNQHDFNRNFAYQWAPEPEQEGAGDYPGSAPETRAVMTFAAAHPNIFAWLNLHTFGGVLIRPLGDKPDHKMDQTDLALYRQVEAWATEFTKYPTVSGYHEFLYHPETPLRGDLTEYAYYQRGAIAYVVELWDIFQQVGIERKKPFVNHYTHLDRAALKALAKWDQEVNHGRVFKPWKKVTHPQLGDVEVGGLDLRVGISNPPYEKLAEVCQQQSAAFLRLAALLPKVELKVVRQEDLGAGLTQIELKITNSGYLATYGLASAKTLPHVEPLRLTMEGAGIAVMAPSSAVIEMGHLEGWGQGVYGEWSMFAPWTRGNAHERSVTIVVKGQGKLCVKVGSCRVGFRQLELQVD